jgi:maltooligosyltrehalose trehalohydrolase
VAALSEEARRPVGRRLGAVPLGDGTAEIRVWAPRAARVAVRLDGDEHELPEEGEGVHAGRVPALPGDDYVLVLDGAARPDPASRFQPRGVDGPSRIVDTGAFAWSDGGWEGVPLDELVLYELHVGTFTAEGTFEAAIPRLRGLRELGVTAVELMPVATFPGERGWGYDGLYAYAPHPAYGGPEGLARLVDAAHAAGLGVFLDVVYNHLGPGGEALRAFGPYVTGRRRTVWGDAIDYAVPAVREWAIQNAELWVRDYHVDGLRLDAVHGIFDDTEPHLCAELAARVRDADPRALVISETAVDDWRPIEEWGHDAQWADRSHHELHALLTGEREGHYEGRGSVASLAEDLRGRGRDPRRLVVCAQNHDQVGNRALGDRLPDDALRVAAAVTLFSPCTPLLFMGEEYLEQRPFRFFADHGDPAVAAATRAGRRREHAGLGASAGEAVPDPQAEETFLRSKLDPREPDPLYRELLRLRRELPRELEVEADEHAGVLRLRRGGVTLVADFAARTVELSR